MLCMIFSVVYLFFHQIFPLLNVNCLCLRPHIELSFDSYFSLRQVTLWRHVTSWHFVVTYILIFHPNPNDLSSKPNQKSEKQLNNSLFNDTDISYVIHVPKIRSDWFKLQVLNMTKASCSEDYIVVSWITSSRNVKLETKAHSKYERLHSHCELISTVNLQFNCFYSCCICIRCSVVNW